MFRKCLCHCDTFSAGISNGAEWYLVDNGMQDFNYLFSNCLELTAELSCWKRPPTSNLQSEWENNLDSMLAVLESVHTGVKGKVIVAETGEPLERASVEVVGRDKQMVTTYRYRHLHSCPAMMTFSGYRGEYWRLLLPGRYQMRASHSNKFGVLESDLTDIEVRENNAGDIEAQIVDLSCRLRLEDSFLVTGVRKGFCRLLENTEVKDEVKEIFQDCRITHMEIFEAECKKVPDDPATIQVAFLVKIVMDHAPMLSFFAERWNEVEVRRPSCEFELGKLERRAAMYSQETWCDARGPRDWRVRRFPGLNTVTK